MQIHLLLKTLLRRCYASNMPYRSGSQNLTFDKNVIKKLKIEFKKIVENVLLKRGNVIFSAPN